MIAIKRRVRLNFLFTFRRELGADSESDSMFSIGFQATENKNSFLKRPLRAHFSLSNAKKLFLIQNFFFRSSAALVSSVATLRSFGVTQVSLHLNLKLRRSHFFRFFFLCVCICFFMLAFAPNDLQSGVTFKKMVHFVGAQ